MLREGLTVAGRRSWLTKHLYEGKTSHDEAASLLASIDNDAAGYGHTRATKDEVKPAGPPKR